MLFKILVVTAAVGLSHAGPVEYSDTSRGSGSSYVTPSPTPFGSESSFHSAESKSYKEDDRRPFSDGPSHTRSGPPKKLGPGPSTYSGGGGSGGGVPLISQHRGFLPPGAVIGYLAYPQPLVHAPLHAESVAHPHATLLPSAAYSHIAYAAPIAFSPYHKHLPQYSSSPSFSSAQSPSSAHHSSYK